MSNIHGFNDLEAGRWRRGSGEYLAAQRSAEDPRCIDIFFPGWTWKSFIVAVSAVQIGVYIMCVAMGSYGLEPSGSTLYRMGSSTGPAIQDGQIWRLVTPMFLHGSIWHIVLNVFFQLRLGLPLERRYGVLTVALLYLCCGLAGNCVSVAWQPCKSAVGASTAGFGLIGIQMAELALSWHLLGDSKPQAIFNIVMFIFISVMISTGAGSHVDWRGHLGGFLAGFAFGIYLGRSMENRAPWVKKYGSHGAMLGVALLYLGTLGVIFFIPMTGAQGRCH